MKKRETKMDCRYCKERMDDYMEGKLQNTDEATFQAHLHTCPECLELFHLQELTEKIITDEKNIVPDFYLPGKIMAKIDGIKDEPASVLIRVLRPALAAISVAAAIMTGVLIGNISGVTADYRVPVELTLMNDAEMESVNVLAAE